MKKIIFILALSFLFTGCIRIGPDCIQYPENESKTCTPTYKLLQGKTWILDSVILNGQNITVQSLAQAKDFKMVITDKSINLGSWAEQILYSELRFNDSSFAYQYISEFGNFDKDIWFSPLTDELKNSIAEKQRPLIFGLISGLNTDPDNFTGIRKLENNILIWGLATLNKDTIITNYFHTN